ncbi:MAG: response regulator [Pseudanabaenaceae cyanobacterium]|jgi:chemotaxis family two-component system response regulator PixG
MDSSTVHSLVTTITQCGSSQFTGKLDLNLEGPISSLYFQVGRIVWAAGGIHPHRRLRRHLSSCGMKLDALNFAMRISDQVSEVDYQVLLILMRRQVLTREQVVTVIDGIVQEVLFDLFQQATVQVIDTRMGENTTVEPLILLSVAPTIERVMQTWRNWGSSGLMDISPTLAPQLKRPDMLEDMLSPNAYKAMVSLLDGKRTLRELAFITKKDLASLTQSFAPYHLRDILSYVRVNDAAPIATGASDPRDQITEIQEQQIHHKHNRRKPLVACVDDSPQTAKVLQQIIERMGLEFIAVQDSLQVLPRLIETKPQLIFLDLVMPIANGYEICAQLRRVPALRQTPIVILTSNDGIVDRVRAKLAGASDFLSKSSDVLKVIETVQKHLAPKHLAPKHSDQHSDRRLDQLVEQQHTPQSESQSTVGHGSPSQPVRSGISGIGLTESPQAIANSLTAQLTHPTGSDNQIRSGSSTPNPGAKKSPVAVDIDPLEIPPTIINPL